MNLHKNVYQYCLFILVVFLLSSCQEENELIERNWQLVWEDNFDGPEGQLPNPANWKFDIGTGWGNNQLEFDTDRPENLDPLAIENMVRLLEETVRESEDMCG